MEVTTFTVTTEVFRVKVLKFRFQTFFTLVHPHILSLFWEVCTERRKVSFFFTKVLREIVYKKIRKHRFYLKVPVKIDILSDPLFHKPNYRRNRPLVRSFYRDCFDLCGRNVSDRWLTNSGYSILCTCSSCFI